MPGLISILKSAVAKGASDIHLIVGNPPMIRVKGKVMPLRDLKPLTRQSAQALAYSVLTSSRRARFEAKKELDCSFAVKGLGRFRMNCYRHLGGVAAAMRVIPESIPKPEKLGLTPAMIRLVDLPRGLVLVTGPTGSGKSTTLASLIQRVNETRARNIITIEDPVEFVYKNHRSIIQQRELGEHTDSFRNALRYCLRQDPDIILLGELRDLDSISLALTAAETGHLVLSTLHTKDAASSISRIVDVFPAHQQAQIRAQLALTLQGVVSQLLLPRRDGSGLIAARELMIASPGIRGQIRDGKVHMIPNAIQTGKRYHMMTMQQSLAAFVRSGVIDRDIAMAKAGDPQTLARTLAMGPR